MDGSLSPSLIKAESESVEEAGMDKGGLLQEIETELSFQNRWRQIMSIAHTGSISVAIAASAIATVAAAMDYAPQAAISAAVATALLGCERTLMLREKWMHHLSTSAKLRSLRFRILYGNKELKEAAVEMGSILQGYAVEIPASEIPPGSKDLEQ